MRHDLICPQGFLVQGAFNGPEPLKPITVDLAGHTLGLVSPIGTAECAAYGFYRSQGFSCPISSDTGTMLTIENGTVAGSVGSTLGGVQLSRDHVEGEVILSVASTPATNAITDGVRDSRIDERAQSRVGHHHRQRRHRQRRPRLRHQQHRLRARPAQGAGTTRPPAPLHRWWAQRGVVERHRPAVHRGHLPAVAGADDLAAMPADPSLTRPSHLEGSLGP